MSSRLRKAPSYLQQIYKATQNLHWALPMGRKQQEHKDEKQKHSDPQHSHQQAYHLLP